MYWPLGVASVFSVPDHDDNPETTAAADDPLISLSRSASSNLLASVTATELFIWQTQVHLFLEPVLTVGSQWPFLRLFADRRPPWRTTGTMSKLFFMSGNIKEQKRSLILLGDRKSVV